MMTTGPALQLGTRPTSRLTRLNAPLHCKMGLPTPEVTAPDSFSVPFVQLGSQLAEEPRERAALGPLDDVRG